MRLRMLLAALASLSAVAAAAQDPENVVRTPMGDWTKLCLPDGADCVIEQVGKTASGEEVLSFRIDKLPEPQEINGERVESVANIRVPLGVVLTAGLRLRIDQGDQSASPYFVCQQNGCVVRAPLQPALIASLKRGAVANLSFTVVQNNEAVEVPVTISLSGFTRAYDSL